MNKNDSIGKNNERGNKKEMGNNNVSMGEKK